LPAWCVETELNERQELVERSRTFSPHAFPSMAAIHTRSILRNTNTRTARRTGTTTCGQPLFTSWQTRRFQC
jgi:hypothetical protein